MYRVLARQDCGQRITSAKFLEDCGCFTWPRPYTIVLSNHVEIFCQFFDEKLAKMRSNTSGAPPPIRIQLRVTRNAYGTSRLTPTTSSTSHRRLPDKSSAADPIPTSVLKQIIDLVAPFIAELFNRSPSIGWPLSCYIQGNIHYADCKETWT